jgi:hypothetical protein
MFGLVCLLNSDNAKRMRSSWVKLSMVGVDLGVIKITIKRVFV